MTNRHRNMVSRFSTESNRNVQNMKGKLEELNEPVDDLMEVSKVQTQILNLTHNQVDIFDKRTKAFRSTYDIMKDISEVWDSLNSTNRASLTEILFGKNRANIGLALIQSFQSGQTQKALKDTTQAAGTATQEYEKMMDGIEAHTNALKGSLQELSNTVLKKETINRFIDVGKGIVDVLAWIIKHLGSISVIMGTIFAMISVKTGTNFIGVLKGIAQWLGVITTNAENARSAMVLLKTAGVALSSALMGLAIGALVKGISLVVDKLIVTSKELNEMAKASHNMLVDLKNNADKLEQSKDKLETVALSYSKIAATVTDVSEKKMQLQEVQNDLLSSYKSEADGIDLVNGKYSEQIKKLDEIARKERESFDIENADKIAEAKAISKMNISESDLWLDRNGRYGYNSSFSAAERSIFSFGTSTLPWEVTPKDIENFDAIVDGIDGIYKGLAGRYYLTGDIEQARDVLSQVISEYSAIDNYNKNIFNSMTEQYNILKRDAQIIKDYAPYITGSDKATSLGLVEQEYSDNIFSHTANAVKWFAEELRAEDEFYNKLDEAAAKLQQLANPDDLSLDEYQTLYNEVGVLENSLYEMAGSSEEARQKVADLFNGFKQGIAENGDGLENFVQKWKTELDENFKSTAETVTTVQEAISKLGEGKGLSHTDAWKLLEQDSEGYLRTIKLINGEYYFSEQELITFKDARIKASQDTIKASIHEGEIAIKNLQAEMQQEIEKLYYLQQEFDLKVKMSKINSESDYHFYHKEIDEAKIKIQEMKDAMLGYAKEIDRDNLLITELNENLGTTRTISVGMETELNNAVKSLENEVKAIDNSIDSLNKRKDTLESEKKELQEQLDILNEQKKVIEEQQKSFQKAVTDYMKRYEDSLKSQLDALKEQQSSIKDEYDERINVLKKENEERDLAYKKEKALLDLNKAKQQQVRTYSSARGWEYGADKEKVIEAQKNLDGILNEEQIKAIEEERDARLKPLEEQEKALDHQIKEYEAYVKQYEILTEEIENKDGELLAEQLLGSDWREKIEKKDEGLLNAYKREYSSFTSKIEQLTKVEIKNIEDSIAAKEKEIDKIGDEITAYNDYKNTVQNSLSEAKNALEDYKNSMNTARDEIIKAASDTEHSVWENLGKIQQWMNDTENNLYNNKNKALQWLTEWGDAYESMQRRLADSPTGYGIINSEWDARLARGYADGGVVDYTGLAMVHGSKQKSETAFNANDSAKLYQAVHETPNVMASIINQAIKLSSFNPSNISVNKNPTANSISLSIGQVVANNPQEFTKNLDTHLDSYFRKKLTQSYAH